MKTLNKLINKYITDFRMISINFFKYYRLMNNTGKTYNKIRIY